MALHKRIRFVLELIADLLDLSVAAVEEIVARETTTQTDDENTPD